MSLCLLPGRGIGPSSASRLNREADHTVLNMASDEHRLRFYFLSHRCLCGYGLKSRQCQPCDSLFIPC